MDKRIRSFGLNILTLVLAATVVLTGCRKDDYNESPDLRLAFSTDSIAFDTVFSSVGSATRLLKVYNNDDSYVNISRVRLVNDANNSYRMNVDGLSGTNIRDVEIGPKDSIFIFVEVTVSPNQNELYPFVEGAIEFDINGNTQDVDLVAWGWDAIFYTPTVFPTNGLPPFTLVDNTNQNATVTWTSERPIVIYGYLVVDSLQTLEIEPGTEIFFHSGSGLWVYKDGNIKAQGSLENPIVFQGDRLEPFFDEEPGQWDRIWINEGSEDNVFEHVLIKNNFIGIQCETLPFGFNAETAGLSDNSLVLRNVAIRNNSIAGIFSRNYRVKAENLLMSSAGQHLLIGTGAGMYNFDQCTFANNWNLSTRQTPAVFLTNRTNIGSPDRNITSSEFINCIIYGNGINEFGMDLSNNGTTVNLAFTHCLFKAEEDVIALYQPFFQGIAYAGQEPGFVNFSGGDFRLREDAFVRAKGFPLTQPVADIIGTPYNTPRPLGCFEYLPE